ncbi:MAG: hypothetical protein VX908_01900 [Planctomycetota bacterium]|nr:hypothetical protein [Planctomycetota bacterium]
MFKMLIATAGMLAIGWLAWSLLKRQGYASPPTDDGGDQPDETQ